MHALVSRRMVVNAREPASEGGGRPQELGFQRAAAGDRQLPFRPVGRLLTGDIPYGRRVSLRRPSWSVQAHAIGDGGEDTEQVVATYADQELCGAS